VRSVNRVLTTATAAVLAAVALYAAYELRHALLILYIAAVLGVLFDPLLERVRRLHVRGRHPSRGAAAAIVTLLTAAVLVLIGFAIVPPVTSDATRLEQQWPQQSARLFDWLHRTIPFTRSVTSATVSRWVGQLGGRAPVRTAGATAMDMLTTLLLAIYMLVDGPEAFEWMVSLARATARPRLRDAFRAGAHRMQDWVAGQSVLMLTHGGSALITFWLLGLPYFLALAVFAAVINIIPVLGPILTLGAASLVALATAPGKLLGVVIFYLAYHNTEGIYLQPRIMASAVGMPAVAIVAALVIGDEVAGFIGMALAVPTAVLIAELKREYAR
jgi:predicted PurR-regulated permease PerM